MKYLFFKVKIFIFTDKKIYLCVVFSHCCKNNWKNFSCCCLYTELRGKYSLKVWNSKECVPRDSERFFLFMNTFTKLWIAFFMWKISFEVLLYFIIAYANGYLSMVERTKKAVLIKLILNSGSNSKLNISRYIVENAGRSRYHLNDIMKMIDDHAHRQEQLADKIKNY